MRQINHIQAQISFWEIKYFIFSMINFASSQNEYKGINKYGAKASQSGPHKFTFFYVLSFICCNFSAVQSNIFYQLNILMKLIFVNLLATSFWHEGQLHLWAASWCNFDGISSLFHQWCSNDFQYQSDGLLL